MGFLLAGIHTRLYSDVPACIQLPMEGQTHGVHSDGHLEDADHTEQSFLQDCAWWVEVIIKLTDIVNNITLCHRYIK